MLSGVLQTIALVVVSVGFPFGERAALFDPLCQEGDTEPLLAKAARAPFLDAGQDVLDAGGQGPEHRRGFWIIVGRHLVAVGSGKAGRIRHPRSPTRFDCFPMFLEAPVEHVPPS